MEAEALTKTITARRTKWDFFRHPNLIKEDGCFQYHQMILQKPKRRTEAPKFTIVVEDLSRKMKLGLIRKEYDSFNVGFCRSIWGLGFWLLLDQPCIGRLRGYKSKPSNSLSGFYFLDQLKSSDKLAVWFWFGFQNFFLFMKHRNGINFSESGLSSIISQNNLISISFFYIEVFSQFISVCFSASFDSPYETKPKKQNRFIFSWIRF